VSQPKLTTPALTRERDDARARLTEVTRLVTAWRAEGARCGTFHATMGSGWKACADALAAVLADQETI
jgi:hypothetical protein